jgi:hypothetical protein
VKRHLSAFYLAWLLAGSVEAGMTLDIRDVDMALRNGSPRVTLEKYFDCSKYEGTAYEAIASGAAQWVSLAERIFPHSDACYTEGIEDALGRAMQRKPENVLPLVGKTEALSPEYICLPFISAELPIQARLAQVQRSRRAIMRVKKDSEQKKACLQFIRSVEISIRADK